MFKKGTKAYSIIHKTCPHCQEGQFFVDNNPYNLSKAGDLLDHCPVCHRKYTPEPGFYYGGMYVAYALAVALFVTIYVATQVLYAEAPLWLLATLSLTGLFTLGPWMYALSKIIWANLFFSYKGVQLTAEELEKQVKRG
ncbi:MAG TPA: DUF983 domain-containing protein [Flavobacteriales bacterium]|nr:DUF983 domain-containing protein [Flavobacteriales bacterium]